MKIFSLFVVTALFSLYAASQTLPSFSFTNAKKENITPAILPQNKPVVVYYFDPYCDKCAKQADGWKGKAAKLSGITILCVSTATDEDNEAFRKKYFTGMQNIFMC